jgi:type II secretory pathway component GspD/PulD (secretin)
VYYFFSFLFFASESELKAQGILSRKISISFKQKSIEEVVRYLQNFHGVPFSYSRNVINLKQKVSGNYDNIKLKAVLDDIFSQSDVIYTFKAEMIILLPKPQNLDKLLITGTIKTIDDGVPVEFAGVQLKSSGKGTITDSKGKFSMIIRKGIK